MVSPVRSFFPGFCHQRTFVRLLRGTSQMIHRETTGYLALRRAGDPEERHSQRHIEAGFDQTLRHVARHEAGGAQDIINRVLDFWHVHDIAVILPAVEVTADGIVHLPVHQRVPVIAHETQLQVRHASQLIAADDIAVLIEPRQPAIHIIIR